MKHPDEVLRIFNRSDEEVLQQSEVKLASFLSNKSRFVECFPQLADPFASEWATATNIARSIVPDYNTSVAIQSIQTEALESLMDYGRNIYQMLVLYVQLTFPGDETALRLIGHDQYESARGSRLKLPILLRTAYAEASKPEYKKALMSTGMKEAELVSLETMASIIFSKSMDLQKVENERYVVENRRITALNSVWEKMALVSECAKRIFKNDEISYAQFLLVDTDASKYKEPVNSMGKVQ